MKKIGKLVGAVLFSSVLLTSCGGPSACDCANAAASQDVELAIDCAKHVSGLSPAEAVQFERDMRDCY